MRRTGSVLLVLVFCALGAPLLILQAPIGVAIWALGLALYVHLKRRAEKPALDATEDRPLPSPPEGP